MARYTGTTCKLCRKEGMKLFLKGDRCHTDKCTFVKRSYAPEQHEATKKGLSSYGVQLREKQKARGIYGISGSQFRAYYEEVDHMKGITDENLLKLLEMRLDSAVYRLSCGASRAEARQLVSHGHFLVNNRKVDIPSYRISVNNEITITEKNRGTEKFKTFIENPKVLPKRLETDVENYSGKIVAEPSREDIDVPANETLIVELYSKQQFSICVVKIFLTIQIHKQLSSE